jgi:hypothetical protein
MRVSFLVSCVVLGACCYAGSPPPVAIAPGFSPQPMTATGLAGGAQLASTLASGCLGNIPMSPQHILEVTAPMGNLTIMVNAHGADATLVVRMPDGTFRCNDDTDGLNPVVTGPVGPGRVEIYVGAYSTDSTSSAYTVGFAESPTAMPSSMP